MAHIRECTYCGKTTVNVAWHQECRIAHLEDLIFRIQKVTKRNSTIHLALQSDILAEKVVCSKESEKRQRQREDKKERKEKWKSALDAHLRECAEKWENKHPDPDPIVYG